MQSSIALLTTLICSAASITVPLGKPEFGRPIARLDDNLYAVGDNDESSFESKLEEGAYGGPLITGCYNVDVYVSGKRYIVMLDSGSSDLLIPGNTLQGYTGPTYDTSKRTPISTKKVGAQFADTSAWTGMFFEDQVSIDPAKEPVSSPFAVMMQQTTAPSVTDGKTSQGLLGIAFDSLATTASIQGFSPPYSVMSALVSKGALDADLIGFRACPASSDTPSVIDWGASNTSLTCAMPGRDDPEIVWIKVISQSWYAVDVKAIYFGDTEVHLDPTVWQLGRNSRSIFDSCTTIMQMPQGMLNQLVNIISNSGAFPTTSSDNVYSFLTQNYGYRGIQIDYERLPVLTIYLTAADEKSIVEMQIPPQAYIQTDATGTTFFTIGVHDTDCIMFGATIFDNYYVVLDRANQRVGLAPGCDCDRYMSQGIPYATAKIILADNGTATIEKPANSPVPTTKASSWWQSSAIPTKQMDCIFVSLFLFLIV